MVDISEYYHVHNTHILGEGISGQVRVCTHKEVNYCDVNTFYSDKFVFIRREFHMH